MRTLRCLLHLGMVAFFLIPAWPAKSLDEARLQGIADKIRDHYEKSSTALPGAHIESLASRFYQARNYQPAWLTKEGWTPLSGEVLETLKRAGEEGLDASDYLDAVDKREGAETLAEEDIYKAEIALTRAMLRYIEDIKGARLDPHTVDGELYVKPGPVDAVALLREGLSSLDSKWIQTLAPSYPEYHALKTLLATYRTFPKDRFGPLIPLQGKLKKGDSGPVVVAVRQRFERLGLLPPLKDTENPVFDTDLEDAIKAFQARHGIAADGVIGRETLNLLNRTVEDYINQIIVTMERWRWMPENPGPRYVRVNIARFELEAIAEGQVRLRMPIVVGLRYRETPQFTAPMTEIIFNPTWHVPHKIALYEKLPTIRKDPSYLRRNNYVLYAVRAGGLERVDPDEVDWHALSRHHFPYRLHQLPGSKNALGKIRFTIVNSFDIYLHSTSQPHLFEHPARAYSHGCIRVRDYLALAEFALNDPEKWSQENIAAMLEDTATRRIPLPQPLPVQIAYFSVGFDDQKEPYFMNDVYGQDAQIWQALQKRAQRNALMAGISTGSNGSAGSEKS